MINKMKRKLMMGIVLFSITAHDLYAMAAQPNPDPNAPPPPFWVSWFPLIFMIGVFYFLIIRPQSNQRKTKQNMLENVKKGDKIVTQGGIHALVVNVGAGFLEVKINEDSKIKIDKSAVAKVVVENEEPAKVAEIVSK